MTRPVSFLAVVLTALALIPYGAHLFSLPNKIGMTQEQYFIAQRAYDGWALMALVLFPADAGQYRVGRDAARRGAPFLAGCRGMPVHGGDARRVLRLHLSGQCGDAELDGRSGRLGRASRRWEYSHAANAVLIFASFCHDTGEPHGAPVPPRVSDSTVTA